MDVNNFSSKAEQIDQFLRANGATSMAIIIHNSMALTKLLNSSIIMFIPSDFALDKIIAKSGQTLNEIRHTKEFIDLISNNFSTFPLQDVSPAYTAVTGVTIGNNTQDLNGLNIIANTIIGDARIFITNNTITTQKQLERLATKRDPGVLALLDYQNFSNLVNISNLKGKDLISFCLSNASINDMCNKEDSNGENIFHKVLRRDFKSEEIPKGKTAREYYIQLSSGHQLWILGELLINHPTIIQPEINNEEEDDILGAGFIKVPDFDNVISVSCGRNHMAIVNFDGRVLTFGENSYKQLGLPETYTDISYYIPMLVPNLHNIKKVECGIYFTSVLDEFGNVWFCGTINEEAGNEINYGYPTDGLSKIINPIRLDINNVVDISAGHRQLGILDANGEVWILDVSTPNPRKFQNIKGVKYINFSVGEGNGILMIDIYNNICKRSWEDKITDIVNIISEPMVDRVYTSFRIFANNIPIKKCVLGDHNYSDAICLTEDGKLFMPTTPWRPQPMLNFIVKDIMDGYGINYNMDIGTDYPYDVNRTYIIDTEGNVYTIKLDYNGLAITPVETRNMTKVSKISVSDNVAAILRD